MTHTANRVEKHDLLIEIGTEELPPKPLDRLREALFRSVTDGLEKANLPFDKAKSRSYSSPRRLALVLNQVAERQQDQINERRGPAVAVAFDEAGKPGGAAIGFARSVGKDVSELETMKTDKGEWLFARQHIPGKTLEELIYPVLHQAIKALPVPKPMRWGNHDFSFVRPVHWLIVLHGENVLAGKLLGQPAGQLTRGHRVHAPGPHRVDHPARYLDVLEQSFVMADQDARREKIRSLLTSNSNRVHIDESLLAEVNNLVEWPVAVRCSFDEDFLEVPHEALVASMQDHQKFFPILAGQDSKSISNEFLSIANSESKNPEAVREGFEKVIRPRLADARFFLEQDLKKPLSAYFERLDKVVFQEKIGTVGDKSRRIAAISEKIAELLGLNESNATRASELCKCDLVTQMVGEFPELQGVMGKHYAIASNETNEVAIAIEEHYWPRFAGDHLPNSDIGQVVSMADKLDSLVGIFAAGLRPTGNKDPFALRRAALGLLRILIEKQIPLPLPGLLSLAAEAYAGQIDISDDLLHDIQDFIIDRARHFYRDTGYGTELILAALSSGWTTLPDLDNRIRALATFMNDPSAASLAAANKRIGNILKKTGESISTEIDENRLDLSEEKSLFDEVISITLKLEPLLEREDYPSSLAILAGLKEPVDDFFDSVMVMDEDPVLKANRLALLARVKALFDRIADLSVLD